MQRKAQHRTVVLELVKLYNFNIKIPFLSKNENKMKWKMMIQPNINSIHVTMNLLIYLPHTDRTKVHQIVILVDIAIRRWGWKFKSFCILTTKCPIFYKKPKRNIFVHSEEDDEDEMFKNLFSLY